jgi:hypothetical protein
VWLSKANAWMAWFLFWWNTREPTGPWDRLPSPPPPTSPQPLPGQAYYSFTAPSPPLHPRDDAEMRRNQHPASTRPHTWAWQAFQASASQPGLRGEGKNRKGGADECGGEGVGGKLGGGGGSWGLKGLWRPGKGWRGVGVRVGRGPCQNIKSLL